MNDAAWRQRQPQTVIDPARCATAVGCPRSMPVTVPICAASSIPIVDVGVFAESATDVQDGAVVRVRGPVYLHTPLAIGAVHPLSGASEDWERGCGDDDGEWSLGLQTVWGSRCLSFELKRAAGTGGLGCAGDVSKSCCAGSLVGELLVVTGKVALSAGSDGRRVVSLGTQDVCRE